jgi:hypothetical protein
MSEGSSANFGAKMGVGWSEEGKESYTTQPCHFSGFRLRILKEVMFTDGIGVIWPTEK